MAKSYIYPKGGRYFPCCLPLDFSSWKSQASYSRPFGMSGSGGFHSHPLCCADSRKLDLPGLSPLEQPAEGNASVLFLKADEPNPLLEQLRASSMFWGFQTSGQSQISHLTPASRVTAVPPWLAISRAAARRENVSTYSSKTTGLWVKFLPVLPVPSGEHARWQWSISAKWLTRLCKNRKSPLVCSLAS